jgi:hypothetical protein
MTVENIEMTTRVIQSGGVDVSNINETMLG